MNIENLALLAERLEALPSPEFSMCHWNCGTAACIGGWTERWWPEQDAYDALGLSDSYYGEAKQLFFPNPHRCSELADDNGRANALCDRIWNRTQRLLPTDAAKVVRNLIATGKVDWSVLNG